MRSLVWIVLLALLGGIVYALWKWRQRWLERQQAAEERMVSFMAQARPAPSIAPPVKPADLSLPQQRLLLEAAAKAGEAGEPALAIQLYARLLSRYPETAFAAQARTAVETQKQKLSKAQSSS